MRFISILFSFVGLFSSVVLCAQETYPVDGVYDKRSGAFLLQNATVFVSPTQKIEGVSILIKKGIIQDIGNSVNVLDGEKPVVVDLKGKYVYAGFIDMYSSFGIAPRSDKKKQQGRNAPPHPLADKVGPYDWNDAIHPQENAYEMFAYSKDEADELRKEGITALATHRFDGIVSGTGAFVFLMDEKENVSVVVPKVASYYSLDKGESLQDYPSSLMGSIALLRQTYLDAKWYATARPKGEGTNMSLQAFQTNLSLPTIFTAKDKWDCLRADAISKEFGQPYTIKASGNEYQIIQSIKSTNARYILPLSFPDPYDVEDVQSHRFLGLRELKEWEMAPANPYFFQKEHIPFAFTLHGLRDKKDFLPHLRQAVAHGLSEQNALAALTTQPAKFLGVENQVGTIEKGKWANFVVTDEPIFTKDATIEETWVAGRRYVYKTGRLEKGFFRLTLMQEDKQEVVAIALKGDQFFYYEGTDTFTLPIHIQQNTITFSLKTKQRTLQFSGIVSNKYNLYGTAKDEKFVDYSWSMQWTNFADEESASETPSAKLYTESDLWYPFGPYGSHTLPRSENLLIKNVRVWTNTEKGILEHADVVIGNGKIVEIGKDLFVKDAVLVDGTGKELTPGLIDEHSHIAIAGGVNEYAQAVTAEVRIGDILNPDDINIYRQLSGGVTTSHILHGSSNPIGGQTQLIKLRWGKTSEELKFKGWMPFIKFALGENVKQSNWGDQYNVRFPQTRMGVEQIMDDAFGRALEYERLQSIGVPLRPDLELDALLEVLHKKRFITCHSYVQSEILMLMRIAEKYNINVNTFTHVLEGYKVADQLKKHGAHVSTFSDWGHYKAEVNDAIPYNAAILYKMGLNVAINSDDAEMGRRLNQEAAKLVRYGSVPEEEALKTVTLNPAKMLHIEDRVGSIQVGKDADVVLWTAHPLSIYAEVDKTIIDGAVYYDRERDRQLLQDIKLEQERLIRKMKEQKGNQPTQQVALEEDEVYDCNGRIFSTYFKP